MGNKYFWIVGSPSQIYPLETFSEKLKMCGNFFQNKIMATLSENIFICKLFHIHKWKILF